MYFVSCEYDSTVYYSHGRYTENRTVIAVFKKTDSDTDIGIVKTDKNRKPKKKPKDRLFGF